MHAPGMKVVGVNGRVYAPEILEDAIRASRDTSRPIEILAIVNDYYTTCAVDYHDGARYPHLVRNAERPDYLAELLAPKAR